MTDERHTPATIGASDSREGAAIAHDLPVGLPAFNWGAFFVPPLWGVAYGQWAGVFFLPVWAFVDNMIRGSYELGIWTSWVGWGMAAVTLALQAAYARTANRIWWHRTGDPARLEPYLRHQRIWAYGGAATIALMGVWIALFLAGGGGTVLD